LTSASLQKREQKVSVMVFLLIFAFLVSWSPYAIVCIMRLFDVIYSPYVVGLALLLAKSSGLTNVIIFILLNKKVCLRMSTYVYVCRRTICPTNTATNPNLS
jgi:uncharacterized membrane protein YhaH (DUF805 family)